MPRAFRLKATSVKSIWQVQAIPEKGAILTPLFVVVVLFLGKDKKKVKILCSLTFFCFIRVRYNTLFREASLNEVGEKNIANAMIAKEKLET